MIGAGALILVRVLARVAGPTVVASESDILDGIAWSLVTPEWRLPRAGRGTAQP